MHSKGKGYIRIEHLFAGWRDCMYGFMLTRVSWLQNRNFKKGYEDPQAWKEKIIESTKKRLINQQTVPNSYLETLLADKEIAREFFKQAYLDNNTYILDTMLEKNKYLGQIKINGKTLIDLAIQKADTVLLDIFIKHDAMTASDIEQTKNILVDLKKRIFKS